MSDTASADRFDGWRSATNRTRAGHPIELWRLRSPRGELRGLGVETPLGHVFFVEPITDTVLARLHPSAKAMVAFAERVKAALVAEDWKAVEEPHEWRAH
jgi:hypothetical protein